MTRFRLSVQIGWALFSNGYIKGYLENPRLYTGEGKKLCLPGLNCYSCPGAVGSCPIGSLQAVIGSRDFAFSFYVVGMLLVFGALLGRVVCGFLCPFGLIQDLLHKIPVPKKLRAFRGDRVLRFLKYGVLLVFVLALPMFAVNIVGQGDPWFCKYICPSGTLMGGAFQLALSPQLRSAVGALFGWKSFVLLSLLLLSLWMYRPFCKYLCPLGAIYGLMNRFSLYQLKVDDEKCIRCGACRGTCDMQVVPCENPNSPECIRCGKCKSICPTGAITSTLDRAKRAKKSARA